MCIVDEDYESVKKIFTLIKMRNLGNLNTLYNFQDTIILCKVFETRVIFFKKSLNLTQENAMQQVYLVVACTEKKVKWL